MSERIYKTWGQRFKLYQNDLSETCFLVLNPMQRCSYHSHQSRANFFFVIEGELVVKTEWGEVTLGPNEFFTVNPPDKHEFQTKEKQTKIIEIAYVSYDDKDIQRDNIGGPIEVIDNDKYCKDFIRDRINNLKGDEQGTFCASCGALYSTAHKIGCKNYLGGPMNV